MSLNQEHVTYFAYGSNMSLARLRARAPSAVRLGCVTLERHDLRFHKAGRDGSAKCDAFYTGELTDRIYGALFHIAHHEKPLLDAVEGLGQGYDEKWVEVQTDDGVAVTAVTYIATHIEAGLKPYTWYLEHVLVGAGELSLPRQYIERKIRSVEAVTDGLRERHERELSLHGQC